MNAFDQARRRLAIAAAALAGFVDAAGFLSTNSYFVSFMSGNTTRLGVDLITAPSAALLPALLIGGFVLGTFTGALLALRAGVRRKVWVLTFVALLLGAAALAEQFAHREAMLALLVLAMGAINNTFQRDGEVSVGLTYMTGALVRLAQGLAARMMGAGGAGWHHWLILWVGLTGGAIMGALATTMWPGWVLWIAAGWAFVLGQTARRLS